MFYAADARFVTQGSENENHGNQGRDVLCRGCNFCGKTEVKTKLTGTKVGMFYAADADFA